MAEAVFRGKRQMAAALGFQNGFSCILVENLKHFNAVMIRILNQWNQRAGSTPAFKRLAFRYHPDMITCLGNLLQHCFHLLSTVTADRYSAVFDQHLAAEIISKFWFRKKQVGNSLFSCQRPDNLGIEPVRQQCLQRFLIILEQSGKIPGWLYASLFVR